MVKGDITSPYLAETVCDFCVDSWEDFQEKRSLFPDGLSMMEYVMYFRLEDFLEYARSAGFDV